MSMSVTFKRIAVRLGASTFLRHVATLVGGQGIAVAIPILTAPILGRLYAPHDYGILGAYMGVASFFGAIGNWQYAQAIAVERGEQRALGLLAVAVWAALASGFLALAAVAGVIAMIVRQPLLSPIASWLWVVPLTTLAVGISGALASFANRRRDYRFMSVVAVANVVVSSIVAIGFGLLSAGVKGLLLSFIVGQLFGFVAYGWRYCAALRSVGHYRAARVISLARWRSSFPRYGLPASMLRSLALAAPTFGLVYMGSADLAGYFSRALSLLALPIGLVGTALAQVFQEKAARERAETGSCWVSYKKMLVPLMIVSPPAFVVLALAAPQLFVLYLGAHWEATGPVAQLLAPMMCLRMIAGPLWPVFAIFNANNRDFWISLLQLAATILFGLIFFALGWPAIWQIVVFALVSSTVNILYITQTFQLVRAPAMRPKTYHG